WSVCKADTRVAVSTAPVMLWPMLWSAWVMGAEATPITRHNVPKPTIPRRIHQDDSCAWRASSLLGRAKNVAPKAFTKQASARPPVSPNAAMASTNTQVPTGPAVAAPWNNDWKVIHSLANPLNGGRAEI